MLVGILLLVLLAGQAMAASQLAVLEFNFVDTSGEARDQRAEHDARLRTLMQDLRAGLASGDMQLVDIACDNQPCVTASAQPEQVIEQCRKSGADFMLQGTVRKTSTLLLSVQAQVIDIRNDKFLFGRFLSFRGDTDEAWRHAASFLAKQIAGELAKTP